MISGPDFASPIRSDPGFRTALFTLKVSYGGGNHRRLWPLNTVNPTLVSHQPSCNHTVKLKHRLFWPLNIVNTKIYGEYMSIVTMDTSLAELIRAKSGSNRVKIGRAYSYSIVILTHSLQEPITQRNDIRLQLGDVATKIQ